MDEAHKMSAPAEDRKTYAYRLGESLSRMTDHFLLMTATPHKGDQDHFRRFLRQGPLPHSKLRVLPADQKSVDLFEPFFVLPSTKGMETEEEDDAHENFPCTVFLPGAFRCLCWRASGMAAR